MNVYVVWEGYEDIIGVFSNKEIAERWIGAHMQKYNKRAGFKHGRDHWSISAHILDSVDRDV